MRAAWLALLLAVAAPAGAGTLADGFASPPPEARPLVRWWWFGGHVESSEIVREIKAMKAGGFGGFELQPVYPLSVEGNTPYLSDDFLKAVRLANDTGRAEGLRVDLTLGSGWPYGGPHITPDLASAHIRMVSLTNDTGDVALPALTAGEQRVAAFAGADLASAQPVAITGDHVTAAKGTTVFLFVQSPTGQQVKRPTVGAEGYVLDHMNAEAVQTHLHAVADRLMTAFAEPPAAVFSDSLEVYGADWTGDLLAEFKKRRGYDLAPLLPALFTNRPDSANVRRDWGLTLQELVEDRYLKPVEAWAKAHDTKFRAQIYGFPPVALSSQRLIDLPEGEGADWRRFTTTRWASSANHAYGNPVTSAESWTWLHAGAFRATPLDIKAEADTLMLEGVNQFVAHGWPYSPPEAGEPGWAFYAAAVFNDHNPWWGVMPDVTRYLTRMSYLLRQGEPVADVAIFLPEDDALAHITPDKATINGQMDAYVTPGLTAQILDAGYNFDYVDTASIAAKGIGHRVLILPKVTRLDADSQKAIADFAQKGGIVLSVDSGTTGRQIAEAKVGETLKSLTPPDVSGAPQGVGFVHRKLADGDLYFVANTSNQTVTMTPAFRAATPVAQQWDARTGTVRRWTPGQNVTLAPYESRVFVFGAAASAPATRTAAVKAQHKVLAGGWTIALADNPAHPVTALSSWTDNSDTAHYSGTAIYSRDVVLSRNDIAAGLTALDFGSGTVVVPQGKVPGTQAFLDSPVREIAEVFVDGKRAGSVWSAPFTVSLKGLVHPGTNHIEIRVSNTAINELAGRPKADYSALKAKYGERFTAQGMDNLQPLPSGLLSAPALVTE
ncbi:glycosyl hydrolase [Asticcacaulis solisilvae]|uniref:glycosyl hydrolase n=1 Tax=Asticcacaulis solisilvae TaxID=1217274 RepID=UPI003FD6C8FC